MTHERHQPVDIAVRKPLLAPLLRALLGVVLPLAIFLAIWTFLAPRAAPSSTFSDFMTLVRATSTREPHVVEVALRGRHIRYWVRDPTTQRVTERVTLGPERMEALVAELEAEQVAIGYELDVEQRLSTWAFSSGVTGAVAAIIALIFVGRFRGQIEHLSARLERAEAAIAREGDRREEA
jgi:hypothetical protein